MSTNREKFRTARSRDDALLLSGKAPAGVSLCADCSVPIQETSTGSRFYETAVGIRQHACSDCYFDAFDEVITSSPPKSKAILR